MIPAGGDSSCPCISASVWFGHSVSHGVLFILLKGISPSTKPRSQPVLAWSLHRVLQYLALERVSMGVAHFLQRGVVLLAGRTPTPTAPGPLVQGLCETHGRALGGSPLFYNYSLADPVLEVPGAPTLPHHQGGRPRSRFMSPQR